MAKSVNNQSKLRNFGDKIKPFQKGKSGNPLGKPKGIKDFRTAIEELFALPADTLEEEIKTKILGINPRIKTLEQAFNARILQDAIAGDSYSKKEILERLHGKSADKVEGEIVHEIIVRFEQ